ncbi:fasciclin domain-containing protein [Aquimarina sp. W85]|uniref:fasciclin domain-containing protein n=1 Tax=Aquimarina rhodophyticola TaxID=3342246 RepID=UPI0036710F39
MKNLLTTFTLSTLLFAYSYSNDTEKKTAKNDENQTEVVQKVSYNQEKPTIVGVAVSNDKFTTLVTAVKAASLVDVLSGKGPFTVFAPLNSAFDKLPKGTVETLLKKENKENLSDLLTYHVVAGKVKAADLLKLIKDNDGSYAMKTVQGSELTARLIDGSVVLTDKKGNTSKVVMTDVEASNGVIHAIDAVVMP